MSSDRPRPRPRPRPKAAPSVEEIATAASSSSSSPLKPVQIHVLDNDEMFMRNLRRTATVWKDLEKKTKETKVVRVDSDSEGGDVTPKRKKLGRKARSPFRSQKDLDRLPSVELYDSDQDDGVEIIGTSTSTPRKSRINKRQRTRSRSITPPPDLSRDQLQHARALVQKTLNTAPRSASPSHEDYEDDTETVLQNPELARLAKSAVERAHSPTASSPAPDGADTVIVTVNWKPHPKNPNGKEEKWVYKMNRGDNFRDLFDATTEDTCIRAENLVMTYKGKRIFASVTPMALQMWGDADLVGCDKVTYEYLRANAAASNSFGFDSATPAPDASDTDDPPNLSQTQDTNEAESDAGDEDTFKLILRSSLSDGKDITLTVRPTTKCGAIVKAYLKKLGVADQYPGVCAERGATKKKGRQAMQEKDPKLTVDGDKLGNNTEIGEADLEDGDLVEVVGL